MNLYWGIVFVLIILIFVTLIQQIVMKPYFRKYKYLIIKKSLEHKDKIKDKKDIEEIEEILEKFGWYAKRWYVNLTPLYQKRWKKFKKILKKYNLNIEIFDYKEGEKNE